MIVIIAPKGHTNPKSINLLVVIPHTSQIALNFPFKSFVPFIILNTVFRYAKLSQSLTHMISYQPDFSHSKTQPLFHTSTMNPMH